MSNEEEKRYLSLVKEVLERGSERNDRTGTGTFALFGRSLRFNIREHFPLFTTKKIFIKGVIEELLWFISGDTNSKTLSSKGVKIWEKNGSREFLDEVGLKENEEGDLGPIYSYQWRHWGEQYKGIGKNYKGIDQLGKCIDMIQNDPHSRRIVMSSWNVSDLNKMALPPCHLLCQFFVDKGELSCQVTMRSADLGLGVPFNVASYSFLVYMIAHIADLKPGELIITFGDTHIYKNHVEPLKEQLERGPFAFPKLTFKRRVKNIDDFKFDDFEISGYKHHPPIKMDIS